MGCVIGFPRGWRCTASLNGWDAGPGNAPKGGSPGLGERQRFPCMLSSSFLSFVKHFIQGNGMYSGVSKGTDGVLLASMDGMSGQATCQKARRPALAKANFPLYDFSFIFGLLSIFVQGNEGWSGVCNGARSVLLDSSFLSSHNDCF